ncbi:MAG TPA: DUF998 domain-containing protein [Streptosporangiaceae bacterium]|jgi:hypothetical membrane protein
MAQENHRPSGLQPRIGGAAWASTVVYFIGQAVAQAAWSTPYSLIDNRISDLGNTACGRAPANVYICSPLHAVMNASFVLTGILLLAGLYLTRRIWPRGRLTTWGLAFLAVTGIGTVLVGLAPENVNVPLHLVGALNIPCGNIALLLLGLANRRLRPGIARLTLVLSAVGFLGMLGGPALIALTGHGGGLAERLALYPAIVWTVLLGLSVLRVRRTDPRARTT